MSALVQRVDAAYAVCEIVETGGSSGSVEAWSGGSGDSEKRRLAGSIVKLKGAADKFAYLPARVRLISHCMWQCEH